MKSIVYYFTGTGDRLEVARKIAEALPDCKLVSMGKGRHDNNDVYDCIGFVYPAYAFNMPRRVSRFSHESSFEKSKNAYFFAVSSCGGRSGCALPVCAKVLKKQGVTLHFAEEFVMVANAVTMYYMKENNAEIQQTATDKIPALIQKITAKVQQPAGKLNVLLNVLTEIFLKLFLIGKSKGFNLSASCTSCGICASVCPVGNISLKETFKLQKSKFSKENLVLQTVFFNWFYTFPV